MNTRRDTMNRVQRGKADKCHAPFPLVNRGSRVELSGRELWPDRQMEIVVRWMTIPPMHEKQCARVYVMGTQWGLQLVLARNLSAALNESALVLMGDPEMGQGGDIVVTTDRASAPADVSRLAQQGERVVVLTAVPNDIAEAIYRQAGARAYLPMVAAAAPIVAAVAGLLGSVTERSNYGRDMTNPFMGHGLPQER